MPLIKRKPVHLHPLPSLSTVLQPLPTAPQHLPSVQPLTEPSAPPSSSSSLPTPALDTQDQLAPPPQSWMPPDGKDDEEQLDRLLGVFSGGMGLTTTKGKRPGQTLVTGQISLVDPKAEGENGVENIAWRITDRECWYIPETGEIFTDYECLLSSSSWRLLIGRRSYSARRAFFYQPLFQCEGPFPPWVRSVQADLTMSSERQVVAELLFRLAIRAEGGKAAAHSIPETAEKSCSGSRPIP